MKKLLLLFLCVCALSAQAGFINTNSLTGTNGITDQPIPASWVYSQPPSRFFYVGFLVGGGMGAFAFVVRFLKQAFGADREQI